MRFVPEPVPDRFDESCLSTAWVTLAPPRAVSLLLSQERRREATVLFTVRAHRKSCGPSCPIRTSNEGRDTATTDVSPMKPSKHGLHAQGDCVIFDALQGVPVSFEHETKDHFRPQWVVGSDGRRRGRRSRFMLRTTVKIR